MMHKLSFPIKTLFTLALCLSFGVTYAKNTQGRCYVEFAKGGCWNDYQVQFKLVDALTMAEQQSFELDSNADTIKVPFVCSPAQQFSFEASFDPPIWEDAQGRWYQAKRIWNVPADVDTTQAQWVVRVCFSDDFNAVPLPVTGDVNHCSCQF